MHLTLVLKKKFLFLILYFSDPEFNFIWEEFHNRLSCPNRYDFSFEEKRINLLCYNKVTFILIKSFFLRIMSPTFFFSLRFVKLFAKPCATTLKRGKRWMAIAIKFFCNSLLYQIGFIRPFKQNMKYWYEKNDRQAL